MSCRWRAWQRTHRAADMASIQTFLERLGIADHPALRVSRQHEGYRDYTFGCRAGPSGASVRNLAHELAHAAEFGAAAFSRRCFMGSFCFKVRKIRVMGRYYPEPRTCSATQRELRTFALQLHLLQHAGERVDVSAYLRDSAKLMTQFMHDWWRIPGHDEKQRIQWCQQQILDHHSRTSPETVVLELKAWLDKTHARLRRQARAKKRQQALAGGAGQPARTPCPSPI